MVYICKLMSWQKRGHLLGNAPPLASAAAPSGEGWGYAVDPPSAIQGGYGWAKKVLLRKETAVLLHCRRACVIGVIDVHTGINCRVPWWSYYLSGSGSWKGAIVVLTVSS